MQYGSPSRIDFFFLFSVSVFSALSFFLSFFFFECFSFQPNKLRPEKHSVNSKKVEFISCSFQSINLASKKYLVMEFLFFLVRDLIRVRAVFIHDHDS